MRDDYTECAAGQEANGTTMGEFLLGHRSIHKYNLGERTAGGENLDGCLL